MDVVVLAGGAIPESLRDQVKAQERALIEIGEKTCLSRVLESLSGVPQLERIFVVTTPQALKTLPDGIEGLPSGAKMTENLMLGARAATSDQILIVTGDLPLVSAQTWREFLEGIKQRDLEAAFPILRRETCEKAFPDAKRTYATLREGTFTGGNAFLLPKNRLEALQSLIETAYNARKNPLQLAGMLGAGFLVKLLGKRLQVAEVEAKMSSLLGCRGGAIEMNDATIAFDIDKPSDLIAARQFLGAPTSL